MEPLLPNPDFKDASSIKFDYDVHGLRYKGDYMERACFRIGLAAAMIAKFRGGCAIMISGGGETNEFNGAKINFPDGG